MNTPAHAVLNLTLLAGGERRAKAPAVFLGALLPDLPMFVFFLWERWVVGLSGPDLWEVAYYAPGWQDFFDVFNSIPLSLFGLAIAWRAAHGNGIAVFASMPFSDFRFESPVSYWDPGHHGAWMALGEAALVVACAAVLWRRTPHRGWRAFLGGLALVWAAGWIAFYGLGVAFPG